MGWALPSGATGCRYIRVGPSARPSIDALAPEQHLSGSHRLEAVIAVFEKHYANVTFIITQANRAV